MKKAILIRLVRVEIISILSVALLAGCGPTEQQVVTIARPSYEKISYQTTEALRGDLSTSMTLELTAEGYEEIVYRASENEFTLEKVHVSVGDRVKKGDILVSFASEELKQKIADYEAQKSQNELLIQHYENLMKVDPGTDYELDIQMLREDIQIAQMYIDEAGMLLAEYQIVAKGDGIITEISEYLQNSVITPGVELITQVTGTGRYLAIASDAEMFVVGDIYPVSADEITYELQLTEISDGTIIFKPVAGTSILSVDDTYELELEMPEQKDVVYINRHALCTIRGEEDTYFVYVMTENGYYRAVFVTPGERIGDNIIITEGLNGGEKVVIR